MICQDFLLLIAGRRFAALYSALGSALAYGALDGPPAMYVVDRYLYFVATLTRERIYNPKSRPSVSLIMFASWVWEHLFKEDASL